MATKNIFLLIPLGAIQGLIPYQNIVINNQSLNFINVLYQIGLYTSAIRLKLTEEEMLNQFIFCGNERQDLLCNELRALWEKIGKDSDKDYPFGNFFALHPDWENCVYEWAKVMAMYKLLKLKPDNAAGNISLIRNSQAYQKSKDDPLIAVSAKFAWSLYGQRYDINEEARAVLAMYLGICSKIGNKTFVATTREEILCRMFGYAKREDLESKLIQDQELKELYDHYASRRRFEKILSLVQERYGIREIGLKRRTYLSYRFKTDESFMAAIAASDKKLQARKRKEFLQELKEKYFGTTDK